MHNAFATYVEYEGVFFHKAIIDSNTYDSRFRHSKYFP